MSSCVGGRLRVSGGITPAKTLVVLLCLGTRSINTSGFSVIVSCWLLRVKLRRCSIFWSFPLCDSWGSGSNCIMWLCISSFFDVDRKWHKVGTSKKLNRNTRNFGTSQPSFQEFKPLLHLSLPRSHSCLQLQNLGQSSFETSKTVVNGFSWAIPA